MSVKSRPPIPQGARYGALPQLETILARQKRTKAWLTAQLGQSRQTWHNNRDAGGWPTVDVPRIAELLGVPVSLLTARGVGGGSHDATTRALLSQPELASLTDDTIAAVRAHVEAAVTRAVAATVQLIADGAVPAGYRAPVADVREMESKTQARPTLARRGQATRGR